MAVTPSQILVHLTSLILCLCQSLELSQRCSRQVFCHVYQAALTQMFVGLSVCWLHFYNCFIEKENAVVEMRKPSDCLIKSLLTVFCFSLVFLFIYLFLNRISSYLPTVKCHTQILTTAEAVGFCWSTGLCAAGWRGVGVTAEEGGGGVGLGNCGLHLAAAPLNLHRGNTR